MGNTINVESWFVWYLLSVPRERTTLVKRMREAATFLAEPIPSEPVLSGQAARVLAVNGIRRLTSRLPEDLTVDDNWYVDELGSIVQFSVRNPASIYQIIRINPRWWQAAWRIWLHAIGHRDDSPNQEEEGSSELANADAMIRVVFELPRSTTSHWYGDCATLNRRKPAPRYERLCALTQYETWDLPLRVTAIRTLPAESIKSAVEYWSGPGALGYDDGPLVQELYRRKR
jgi:hypothetical protein